MISTHFSGHPLCPVFLFIVIPQGLLGLEPTRAHFTMEDVLLLVGALQVGLKGSGKLLYWDLFLRNVSLHSHSEKVSR